MDGWKGGATREGAEVHWRDEGSKRKLGSDGPAVDADDIASKRSTSQHFNAA